MYFAYIDESGGTEDPLQDKSSTPVRTIVTLMVPASAIPQLTRDYVALKTKYFYQKMQSARSLDLILAEVKGSELLKMTRSSSRNKRRAADRFRTELLRLVANHGGLITARVWVKSHGQSLDDRKTYGQAMQDASQHFNALLEERDDIGVIVADSRNHESNRQVAHSVFTQMWRAGTNPYPRVAEVPMFAASENHAGIQIADLIATTLVFPMSIAAFCVPVRGNVHDPRRYAEVRRKFSSHLRQVAYKYKADKWTRGGIKVSGDLGTKTQSMFFEVDADAS